MHGLLCETLALLGPLGLHTTAQELQTCTPEGRGFRSHHRFHKTTKRGNFGPYHPSGPGHFGAKPFGAPAFGDPPRDLPLLGCCLCCFAPDFAAFLDAAFFFFFFFLPTVEPPPPPLPCLTFQNVNNIFSQLIGAL